MGLDTSILDFLRKNLNNIGVCVFELYVSHAMIVTGIREAKYEAFLRRSRSSI